MKTKKCPYCQSEINSEAKKCRFCMEMLPDGDAQSNIITQELEPNSTNPTLTTENKTQPSIDNDKLLIIPSSFDTYFNKSWTLLVLLYPAIKIFIKLGTESGLDFLTIAFDIVISLLIYILFQFMSNFQYNRKPLKILLICYVISTSTSAIFSLLEYFNEDWISGGGSLFIAIVLIFSGLSAYLLQIIFGFIVALSFLNYKTEIIVSKNFKLLSVTLFIISFIGAYDILSSLYELISGNSADISTSIVSFIFITAASLFLIYSIYRIIKIGVDYNNLHTIEEDEADTQEDSIPETKDQVAPDIGNIDDFLQQLHILIRKQTNRTFGSDNKNEILALLSNFIVSKEIANITLEKYSDIFKSDLISELKELSSSYSVIKTYVAPFIDYGVVSNEYPHELISR